MRMSTKPALIFAACVTLLVAVGCGKTATRTTKVTVAGEAIAKVEPDTAIVTISVVTQSPQALTAQQQNTEKSEAVSNAVKATAGSSAELKTSDYTLQPQYDNRDNRLPKIIGYDARNSIIVTMTDLKNVGAVIDAASRAGANSIDGISFVLKQTSPARGQALSDATQQAMNKANSIATALGGHVLRVVEENEGSTINPEGFNQTIYDGNGNVDMTVTKRTPIASGQLSIKSNVQLVVEIQS